MDYLLNEHGFITKLDNNKIDIDFHSDNIYIETNKGIYDLSKLSVQKKDNYYIYMSEKAVFKLEYLLCGKNFIKRRLSLKFFEKTELYKIGMSIDSYDEAFLYRTFLYGSGAVFARERKKGLFFGFENPYFYLSGNRVEFEPNLILEPKEEFDCDINFIGLYELWGEKVVQQIKYATQKVGDRYYTRFRNPSEGIPLYFSETYEFNEYTKTYFETDKKPFKFISYDNFSNLPYNPGEDIKERYFKHIDNCVKLGIELIIFNPLCENKIPNEDLNSYWELFPENTLAEEIYDYAKNKGLDIGIYMGASVNVKGCNDPHSNYTDNPKWKKIDVFGDISRENCIGSKEFLHWYIEVQKNTIRKYNLKLWNWDPGPGDCMYCFSENHGHLKGKGEYKGFRNHLRIMAELKREFPDLYIIGFYGNKRYGLWGYKYIDQHEGYWEAHIVCDIPLFEDMSADRQTASDMRFQSNWNYYFRFMHQTLNHGLTFHMTQDCGWFNEPDCDKLFDYCGYKYALLSVIACGGSLTLPIVPRYLDKEVLDFYKYWVNWQRENWEYSKNTIPFGEHVGVGVEGYSKLIDNKGFIFLVNSGYKPLNFSFVLNERVGFTGGEVCINNIYPERFPIKEASYNDKIDLIVPEYSVMVLELADRLIEDERKERPKLPTYIPTKAGKGSFFASGEIKKIIESYNITDEIIKVGDKLNHCSKNHILSNIMWYRPDRLWLCVFIEGEMPKITLNGEDVALTLETFLCNIKLVYFADITDKVKWNEINEIQTTAGELYLQYENIPMAFYGYDRETGNYNAPVLDTSIKITEAIINDDNIIYPNEKNIIKCKVNVPYEELEGVYNCPIWGMDCLFEYKDGFWVYEFDNPTRVNLILEDSKIAVWAVTKDRRESETYFLKINWKLS